MALRGKINLLCVCFCLKNFMLLCDFTSQDNISSRDFLPLLIVTWHGLNVSEWIYIDKNWLTSSCEAFCLNGETNWCSYLVCMKIHVNLILLSGTCVVRNYLSNTMFQVEFVCVYVCMWKFLDDYSYLELSVKLKTFLCCVLYCCIFMPVFVVSCFIGGARIFWNKWETTYHHLHNFLSGNGSKFVNLRKNYFVYLYFWFHCLKKVLKNYCQESYLQELGVNWHSKEVVLNTTDETEVTDMNYI